jgi:putative methyltransferase (TIGR04325 family)
MTKMERLKQVGKMLLPPLVIHIAKHGLRNGKPEWEYVAKGWKSQEVNESVKGWNVQSILDTYITHWPDFVTSLQRTSPLGLSPEASPSRRLDLAFHNVVMSYGYALGLAAHNQTALSMLDWGGGIGHYYLISKALFPMVQIDYHCKDLSLFVEHGRGLFPEAYFYSDESCLNRLYDFVLVSSSLQYSEYWQDIFGKLAMTTSGYLYITRLPVVHKVSSYVMIQRPYRYGYNTEYLGWCINRNEILDLASTLGLKLVREFAVEFPPTIQNAPEQCDYWGFLFSRSTPTETEI